jgi:hypothetical protein
MHIIMDTYLLISNLKLLIGRWKWSLERCWDENYRIMWWFTSCYKSDGWITKYKVEN